MRRVGRTPFFAIAIALAACASPQAPPPAQPTVDAPPSTAPAFEFVTPDEVAIDGVVVAPDGTPVERAQIIKNWEARDAPAREVRVCTGADGRFRLGAPRDTKFGLRFLTPTAAPAHGWRYAMEYVSVPTSGPQEVVVRLRPGAPVAGRVLDGEGRPVACLRLRTRCPAAMSSRDYFAADATTRDDGSFAFDALATGRHTIDENADAVMEHVLVGAADLATGRTDYVLRRLTLARIAGRVVDAGGHPVARRTVVLDRRGEPARFEFRTDANGWFRGRVAAPGSYVVRLRTATQSGPQDREMGDLDVSGAGGDADAKANAAAEPTFVAPPPAD